MSSDMNTAVVTFDADGLINFDDGEQNVPYATRASQTWVNEKWRVEGKILIGHQEQILKEFHKQINIFVFVD